MRVAKNFWLAGWLGNALPEWQLTQLRANFTMILD